MAEERSAVERIAHRDYPSVFQAWNPIDTQDFPLTDSQSRLRAAAKHDVLWEEPVSQLGYGVNLVLGAVWDGQYGGLSKSITIESLKQALKNRREMLQLNPHMVFLFEVRWRDAPGSFLPEESPFWQRNDDGTRKLGWDNGPEPYYLLDRENPDFRANIARQCKVAVETGIYDGVMFDWDGYLPIIQEVRTALGNDPLIIVNIHDSISLAEKYGKLINGAFMELAPEGPGYSGRTLGTWESSRQALLAFETLFRKPRVNCLEAWGDRSDLRRMRAITTLALTHSDGSVLYADPNDLKTPDHLHDWYAFWDTELGAPLGSSRKRKDGAFERDFSEGTAIYNPLGNGAIVIEFAANCTRVSDGVLGKQFQLQDADGDLFLSSQANLSQKVDKQVQN